MIKMAFHSVMLSEKNFKLLPIAKKEFLEHHPKWEVGMLSNNKIIYEAILYYIKTGKYKNLLDDMEQNNNEK
jgi:hypothetical protein